MVASLSAEIGVLDAHGVIVTVNDAWRDSDDAVLPGTNYLDVLRRRETRGSESARSARKGVEAVLARRMRTFRSELWCDGGERCCDVVVDALGDDSGGAVVTRMDVTEQRRVQTCLESARRAGPLAGSALMGEVASAFAQEIRDPIASIRLNALAGASLLGTPRSTFDDVWSDSREAWQMFKDIYDDASRASTVVDFVRQHARKHESNGRVDLDEACRETAALIHQDAMSRGATIELELEPGLPVIAGDQTEIQQMLICLAVNALDAVASVPANRTIVIGTAGYGAEVELFVRDTGPGLAPAARQRAFESFFTTKDRGLGMGLVIVRSIAERHRGHVSAENAPTGGSVFRVRLPIG